MHIFCIKHIFFHAPSVSPRVRSFPPSDDWFALLKYQRWASYSNQIQAVYFLRAMCAMNAWLVHVWVRTNTYVHVRMRKKKNRFEVNWPEVCFALCCELFWVLSNSSATFLCVFSRACAEASCVIETGKQMQRKGGRHFLMREKLKLCRCCTPFKWCFVNTS